MKRYKQYLEPDTTYMLPRTTRFRSNTYSSNNDAPGPSNNEHPELEDRNSVNGTEVHNEEESETNEASDGEAMELEEGNCVEGDSETASDGEVTEADESDEGSDVEEHDGEESQSFAHDTGPKFDENLNVPVCRFLSITKAELLLLFITFTLRHNLSFAALLDLLKLINFVFSKTVLPASKHMLSKVFTHFSQRTELPLYILSVISCKS